MKVIGINASPRKNANTQTLVESVLNGAAQNGARTRLVNLRDLNINGCLGCEGCKKHIGKCVQKDDLTPLLQELKDYDAIVLGTPVYWFHVSAQFKMLVDRLYSFLEYGTDPETGKDYYRFEFPAGKKFVVVVSRGDGEPTQMLPQFYDYLNEWLNMIPLSLGASSIDFVHHYGAETDRKSAKNNAGLIEKAQAAGSRL
ncbi:MAG: flavodoxin family protein [Desulfobacterales bacterium]|jgi:multimeric flavodoxin WrbA|nr:flavodoxin family protein [Desulfobacterales bacterium]